jgi:cell division septal protein FtsQ
VLRETEAEPAERFLRRAGRPRRATRRGVRPLLRGAAALSALLALAALGFWTAAAASRARELAVSRIVVEGNQRLSGGEILETLGLYQSANILALDLPELKQKLLRSPWIKDAELARVLPGTLTLRIVERAPVGIAVLDRLYLMDEEGVLLDELTPRYRDLPLPLVRGLSREGTLSPERAALSGRVLAAVRADPRLESALSELAVSEAEEGPPLVRLSLRHPPLALLAREKDLVPRLREVLPLATELAARFPELAEVDLTFRDRIYLRLPAAVAPAVEPATQPGGR